MRSISVSLPINGSSASILAASVKSRENSDRLNASFALPGACFSGNDLFFADLLELNG